MMNLKTTLVLLILVVVGGVLLIVGPAIFPGQGGGRNAATDLGSRAVLEKELSGDQVKSIQVVRGNERIVLERGADGQWTLPGGWRTRPREIERLVKRI